MARASSHHRNSQTWWFVGPSYKVLNKKGVNKKECVSLPFKDLGHQFSVFYIPVAVAPIA